MHGNHSSCAVGLAAISNHRQGGTNCSSRHFRNAHQYELQSNEEQLVGSNDQALKMWLSSNAKFAAWIDHTQLLRTHVAEKTGLVLHILR